MRAKEFITEGTLTSKVWKIVDAINDEINKRIYERLTGKRKTMMGLKDEKVNVRLVHVKEPSSRVWTRGDGSRYREPGYLYVEDADLKRLQRKYSTIKTLFPTMQQRSSVPPSPFLLLPEPNDRRTGAATPHKAFRHIQ